MNQIYNYYDILKKIKNIQFTHSDIQKKCYVAKKVIKLLLYSNQTLNHCLKESKVAKSTFFDIVSNIHSNNELSLINKSRARHKTQNKYNWSEILPKAYSIQNHKNRDFSLTIRQLTTHVNHHFNINLSYSQLGTKLREYTTKIEYTRTKCIQEFKKWEIAELGYIQMDGIRVSTTIRSIRKPWHIFTAVDCYSRLLFCKCYDEQTKTNAIKFYKEAKEFFLKNGIHIFHIRTDNGYEWVNCAKKKPFRRVGTFEMVLHNEFIEHDTTDPSSPNQNGKVERSNKSVKNEFLKHNKNKKVHWTIELLNKKLLNYMNNFNKKRIHSTLNKTPIEVVQNYIKYGILSEHVFI